MEPTAGAVIDTGSIRKLPGVNLRQDIICVQLKTIRLCNFYNPFIKGGRWPFLPLTFSCRRSERSLGDFSKYCRNFYNWLPIAFLRLPIFFICQPASTDMQQQATIQVLLIYRKKGHRPSAIKLKYDTDLWLRNLSNLFYVRYSYFVNALLPI